MTALIHINDNNILIQEGDSISRSQGYAWLKDGEVHFDFEQANNAVANCRLDPQKINSRYWQQCEQSTIVGNDCGMRHSADLIWRHLLQLKEVHQLNEIVLIVPSHYQNDNLQLLLGIVQSCGLKVKALINKAVYAIHNSITEDGNYLHVDVQLHQTVCSELTASNGKLKLAEVEIWHDVGIQAMQDSLLKAIQNRFIANDRFDPLHHAETEQQLFDQLPLLAEGLTKAGKANISVDYQYRQHVSSIDNKQWNETLSHYLEKLRAVEIDSKTELKIYDFNGFDCLTVNNEKDFSVSKLLSPSSVIDKLILRDNEEDENSTYHTEIEISTLGDTASLKPNDDSSLKRKVSNKKKLNQTKPRKQTDSIAVTHLLQSGIAIPIENVQINTTNKQLSISHNETTNVKQMLKSSKLFIMGSDQRLTMQVDDRLGSDLADGVITAIHLIQKTSGRE